MSRMCCLLKKLDFIKCILFLMMFLSLTIFYPLYYFRGVRKLLIGCSSTVLTTPTPKYLEEMLWAYTTLWSIRRMNLTRRAVCVPKVIVEELRNIFQSLSLCTLNTLPFRCNYEVGSAPSISPNQYPDSSMDGLHVSINFSGKAIENPKPMLYSAKYMESEFVLSDKLTEFARRAVQKSTVSVNLDSFDSPLVTVCVCVKQPSWFPVSRYFRRARESFFTYSMDIFRKHYRPLFVALGDVSWATDKLESGDLVTVRTKHVGQFLAIMAACNHTIIEPTPLSLWGAFRNRGFKIVYDLPQVWYDLLYVEKDWLVLNLHHNSSFVNYSDEDLHKISNENFLFYKL